MGIALWVVQVLGAGAFVVSGATKLSQPKEKLLKKWAWVEDFSQRADGHHRRAAGTRLGPVQLSVTDGGRALRFGEDRQARRHRNTDKAITLTLLRDAAGLPLVPPFPERRKPWLRPSPRLERF